MKKRYMLRKNWEFQKIIDSKKQISNKYMVIYYAKSDEFRVGISIPKKFANAVQRNYNKRVIKAILGQYPYYSEIKKTLVIISRKEFLKLDFQTRKNELIKLLERIRNGTVK
ncbi:ribonuclease P protein component [Mycoplasma testudineum]|uniref:Ribonuclease P protein component n=1 Tax=Mycoplasma testudineum TaxID=244584 RepID=A0A4R6IDN8_9MOLU|nr:ribonuclease P protein component [Mycoplasma testudineum]OYD26848.1 ribonuclease P protein component [Mycoplasma testudineum]TDO20383.1 ribonuclease P protein component [Mycoplasma testudineum]